MRASPTLYGRLALAPRTRSHHAGQGGSRDNHLSQGWSLSRWALVDLSSWDRRRSRLRGLWPRGRILGSAIAIGGLLAFCCLVDLVLSSHL